MKPTEVIHKTRQQHGTGGVGWQHRGQLIAEMYLYEPKAKVVGIPVCVVRLACSLGWWIVPAHSVDDDTIEDLGPFPTANAALLALKLLMD